MATKWRKRVLKCCSEEAKKETKKTIRIRLPRRSRELRLRNTPQPVKWPRILSLKRSKVCITCKDDAFFTTTTLSPFPKIARP